MILSRYASRIHRSLKNNNSLFSKGSGAIRKMSDKRENHLVWIDTELTGLEIEKDHILEISCLITDHKLDSITDDLNIVIHQPDAILDNMNDWCKIHHKQTGLIQESQESKIDLKEAENRLLDHLKKFVPEKSCPMAGNTIFMDRMFLIKHMPRVNEYLHYRIIDVSSVRELARRWNPKLYNSAPKKSQCHRALPDIKESIQELAYYKSHMFI